MAPSRIRRALGAVKDQTSIGLAKVSTTSNALSDLEVAVVKATRHDENPADEKHIREILSLTCYSPLFVTACVDTIARRLTKTRSWTVALKSLVLVHRLLLEGDPSFDQEVFFATRRGTRLLNLSDFRDSSGSWDLSAFARTFARYLDERLEYRVQGRRDRRRRRTRSFCDDEEAKDREERVGGGSAPSSSRATPLQELQLERIFHRLHHLQSLLDRFLACRPTGAAKNNRIVAMALYPLVKESYQLYYDIAEIISILIDRFGDLDVPDCIKIYDIFSCLAKQFDDLDIFYTWCKSAGIARSSEYPDIDRITQKKLEVMDEFIRDKSALASTRNPPDDRPEEAECDMNAIKALPAPEDVNEAVEERKIEEPESQLVTVTVPMAMDEEEEEIDFLNLKEDPLSFHDHANKFAIALFDGVATTDTVPPKWEAFADDHADWETALVQSASALPHQRACLGGGFDLLMLDGMYQQPSSLQPALFSTGSASSVTLPVVVGAGQELLALPAPPGGRGDPFAASAMIAPPSYVQMSDMERKQRLLMEEQAVWQQYAKEGMHGAASMAKVHGNSYLGVYHQQQQQQQQQRF